MEATLQELDGKYVATLKGELDCRRSRTSIKTSIQGRRS